LHNFSSGLGQTTDVDAFCVIGEVNYSGVHRGSLTHCGSHAALDFATPWDRRNYDRHEIGLISGPAS